MLVRKILQAITIDDELEDDESFGTEHETKSEFEGEGETTLTQKIKTPKKLFRSYAKESF